MRKLSLMQRLLREHTLERYIAALEKGDLDTVAIVMRRAERDATLEQMIFEIHEQYQTEEEFRVLAQEEKYMDLEDEGIHKSRLKGQVSEAEPELAPLPRLRQRRRYARGLQILAAVLLVACLLGGSFLYLRLRPQHGAQSAANGHLQYNWCSSTGAPVPSASGTPSLNSIAAISPNDIWALGGASKSDFNTNTRQEVPLIEHWNGVSWSVVPGADPKIWLADLKLRMSVDLKVPASTPANTFFSLLSLSAVSATDIWAVGSAGLSYTKGQSSYSIGHTVIEHWNGQRWQLANSPDGTEGGWNTLSSVVALSANDVWAVGYDAPASVVPGQEVSLVEHWDGGSWSIVQLPSWLNDGSLSVVTGTSSHNIWIGGESLGTLSNHMSTLILAHWDGSHWSSPKTGDMGNSYPYAIQAISANDVWVTTSTLLHSGSVDTPPFIGHWDGSRWSVSSGASGVGAQSELFGLAVNGPRDIWAVGVTEAGQGLIEHWDGTDWHIVHQQKPVYGQLTGVAIVGGKIWIVGETTTPPTQNPSAPTGPLVITSC